MHDTVSGETKQTDATTEQLTLGNESTEGTDDTLGEK